MSFPVSSAEFAALMAPLGPFEPFPRIGVAVSGGADSLALALLVHDWAKGLGGEAIAVTVDHRLRPEAGAEAAQAGRWLAAHGMDHRVLAWDGPKPKADLQAAAREARYGLLENWARDQGILHVLLAHHRDDQAETLLLRLGRGSGVDGLSAMAAVQEGFAVRWLRPLLTVPRVRLVATLKARGQGWVEDPSNRNPAFARVRMRGLLPVLAAEGLTPERLAATASRLGRARAALDQTVAEAAARWVSPHPGAFAWVDPQAFLRPPEEVGLRLLSRLLTSVGGGAYGPRAERTQALFVRLRSGLSKAATLAGCRVVPSGGRLLFCREVGRMAPPLPLVPGAEMAWDGRFRLKVAENAPPGLVLAPLGPTGWNTVAAAVRPRRLPVLPPPVRATLPAVYADDALCAVPHLGYNRSIAEARALRWIIVAAPNPLTVAGHCLV